MKPAFAGFILREAPGLVGTVLIDSVMSQKNRPHRPQYHILDRLSTGNVAGFLLFRNDVDSLKK